VLIRHQLTGTKPDLHTAVLAKEQLQNTAIMVAQILKPNEKLSINKLASIANVPRSTAARLLKDKEFQQWLKTAQGWVADGLFSNLHKPVSH
jgi:predicted transcriptional regulator